MPILKKFIGNDQVDGAKTLLLNDQALRSKNSSGTSVELMKFDSANVLQFLQMPQITSDPVHPNELTRKSYVDNLAQGVAWKQVVRASIHTTGLPAYTYSNGAGGVGATITANVNGAWDNADSDDVVIAPGDRVIIFNDGAAAIEYGIYTVTSLGGVSSAWQFTRAVDADGSPSSGELLGATVTVIEGTTHAGITVRMNTPSPITVGTTPLLWDHISSGLSYNFIDGLQLVGSDVSVKADTVGGANLARVIAVSANGVAVHVDDASIEENLSGQLGIKAAGIQDSMLASDFVHATGDSMTGDLNMEGNDLYQVASLNGPTGLDLYLNADLQARILGPTGIVFETGVAGEVLLAGGGTIPKMRISGGEVAIETVPLNLSNQDITNVKSIAFDDGVDAFGSIVNDGGAFKIETSGALIKATSGSITVDVGPGGESLFVNKDGLNIAEITSGSGETYFTSENPTYFSSYNNKVMLAAATGFEVELQSDTGVKAFAQLDMTSHKIVNVTDPTSAQDVATKNYVDNAASGSVSDAFYDGSWNGVTGVAPSKNAVYDELETLFKKDGSRSMTGNLNMSQYDVVDPKSISLKDGTTYGTIEKDPSYGMKIAATANMQVLAGPGSKIFVASEINMTNFKISDLLDPSSAQDAATKNYVDNAVAGVNSAAEIAFTPYGSISSTNVQNAIEELDTEKLALAGGTMSGDINMSQNDITDSKSISFNDGGAYGSVQRDAIYGMKIAGTANVQIASGGPGSKIYVSGLVDLMGSSLTNAYQIEGGMSGLRLDSAVGTKVEVYKELDMKTNKIVNLVNPSSAQDAATKNYVDTAVAGKDQASEISFTPYGNITAANVQDAIEELDDEKLALAGGTMSGNLNMGGYDILDPRSIIFKDGSTYGSIVSSGSDMAIQAVAALKLDAGVGSQIEVLNELNMNSLKIVNLLDPTSAQDAATKGYVDGLSVAQLVHQTITLSAGDISNQYVDVTDIIVGEPWIQVGRVSLVPTDDFTVGNNGSSQRKRITFAGSVAAAGAEALESGDKLSIYYTKSVTLA